MQTMYYFIRLWSLQKLIRDMFIDTQTFKWILEFQRQLIFF